MIIAIVGPDGSGKSTIADEIVSGFETQGMNARHHAFRFGVLPKLSLFRFGLGKKAPGVRGVEDRGPTHDLSENSALWTIIYMIWYTADFILGATVLGLRNLAGRKRNVAVFARYFYDYYYQSNNRRLAHWVKRLIGLAVPRPRFIFFLDRDAQSIHDGKPELPVYEILTQQRLIRMYLSRLPQFHEIDARQGVEKTARDILRIVAERTDLSNGGNSGGNGHSNTQ